MHTPGPMRQNKYAKWHACKRCGLRLSYTTKGTYQGETRAIGPDPLHVEAAQLELKEQYAPMNMNEKIFNGKLMEIRGRGLVQTGGAGRTTVEIKANEPLGKYLMEGYNTVEPGMASTTTPTMPTPTPRNAEEFNQEPKMPSTSVTPKAVAKAKVHVKKEPMAPVTSKAAPSTPAMEPPKEVIIQEVDDVLTVVSSEEEG